MMEEIIVDGQDKRLLLFLRSDLGLIPGSRRLIKRVHYGMRFQGTFLVQLNKFYEALLGKYPVSFVEYFLFYQACSCVADTGLGNPKFFFVLSRSGH
jgi:hypothetical protein